MYGEFVTLVKSRYQELTDWSRVEVPLERFVKRVDAVLPFEVKFLLQHSTSVVLYRPGDKYTLGALTYTAPGYRQDEKFGVVSRFIKKKRSVGNKCLTETKHLEKAVRKAKEVLLPHRPTELATEHLYDFKAFLREQHDESNRRRDKIVRELTDSSRSTFVNKELLVELAHLLRSGHEFVNPQMRDKLTEYFEADRAYEQTKNTTSRDAIYIHVYDHNEQQVVDIVALDSATQNKLRWENDQRDKWGMKVDFRVRMPIEQLPPWMTDKLFTLSILQPQEGAQSVGWRASDDEFFIFPEPATTEEDGE